MREGERIVTSLAIMNGESVGKLNWQAVDAAAKWLAANPDKHIRGAMARDALGQSISPTHPRAACFCAVGRIIKEAWPQGRSRQITPHEVTTFLHTEVGLPNMAINEIVRTNDRPIKPMPPGRGSPDVLTILEKIAA